MEHAPMFKDPGGQFGLVASLFNQEISQGLVDGALKTFAQHGIGSERIEIVWVPGALELPLATRRLSQTKSYQAIIALGCVIQGETAHFDVVVTESCHHLSKLSLELDLPILLGVLTTLTRDQATARSGPNEKNKGSECALAALQFVNLLNQLGK